MSDSTTVSTWLEKKFLEWQNNQGERKTIKEFAKYLGIPQTTVNNYMRSNRLPSREHTRKLSEKLGAEIYTLLGPGDPEEEVRKLLNLYDQLDEQDRKALIEEAQKRIQKKR